MGSKGYIKPHLQYLSNVSYHKPSLSLPWPPAYDKLYHPTNSLTLEITLELCLSTTLFLTIDGKLT